MILGAEVCEEAVMFNLAAVRGKSRTIDENCNIKTILNNAQSASAPRLLQAREMKREAPALSNKGTDLRTVRDRVWSWG